ncbi:RNA polymerase sigma factor [Sorangium atrum]|uniref:Sigma-70 family RNA polymerase sigma factor n=1 Tax=Sorangium atrum TaxID=2995308 RepID=A0ABT5C0K4_9BACT|nr:sigma-70 family RNA polymerase sigma factor [Sorangium aterium]MDC0678726.1 sigma-70 family RNA polymerase sigma factor [Sorangium aterium]
MAKPATVSLGFELFRRLARRHGVPARDAEDVAQEALLRGLDADKRIEPGGDPGPYRVTIAVNQARNHVRDARGRGEVLTSFDECEIRDECLTPEELLRRRQREKLARELIDQLEPKYRDLVIKHDLEDIPLAQIAAEQGIPLDTVKTRHRRALEELEVQGGRRRARQRSRGWDDSACVPVALGFGRRASWVTSLRRFGMRILVQAALVLMAGALVSTVPPLPGLESWTRAAAVRAPATAPAERDAVAPPARGGAHSAAGPAGGDGALDAAAPAAAIAHEISSRTEHGSAHGEAMVIGTPAPSNAQTTSHRAAPPASAVRPTAGEVERSLVDQARRAIEANDVMADVEARRLLEAHARQFPRGRLAAEREELFRQLR